MLKSNEEEKVNGGSIMSINIDKGFESKRTRGFEVVKNAPADTKLPVRSTKHSAGYDFFAPKTFTVPAKGFSEVIWTNIKAYMLDDEMLGVHIRSSMGVKIGVMIVNNVGIIDADYYGNPNNDGNIGFKLYNLTNKDITIEKGERVVQGIFQKYLLADNDNAVGERTGGTGSTGK